MAGARRFRRAVAASALLPLAAGLALAWAVTTLGPVHGHRLLPVAIGSARGLERVFAAYRYRWPPAGAVPPLALVRLPRGLDTLAPERRKRLFLRALLPLVVAANDRIRAERRFLRRALDADAPAAMRARRRALARKYRVQGVLADPAARARLLRRCDTVPPGLVLAQAAKESGWGTSGFALHGNNLFGVWTWDPRSGVVPSGRGADATHLVRTYSDLAASVRDYLYNLNVGHAYQAFRRLRARERAGAETLDPLALARTLHRYSQGRATYVARLITLIVQNGLEALPQLRLTATPGGFSSPARATDPSNPAPARSPAPVRRDW